MARANDDVSTVQEELHATPRQSRLKVTSFLQVVWQLFRFFFWRGFLICFFFCFFLSVGKIKCNAMKWNNKKKQTHWMYATTCRLPIKWKHAAFPKVWICRTWWGSKKKNWPEQTEYGLNTDGSYKDKEDKELGNGTRWNSRASMIYGTGLKRKRASGVYFLSCLVFISTIFPSVARAGSSGGRGICGTSSGVQLLVRVQLKQHL